MELLIEDHDLVSLLFLFLGRGVGKSAGGRGESSQRVSHFVRSLTPRSQHHRYGKGGRNYGKQSRVWDVVFGTTTPREEMKGMKGHYE